MQAFVDRFKAKASKAKQAQSRIKMIEKMDDDHAARRGGAQARLHISRSPTNCHRRSSQIEGGSTGYTEGPPVLSRLNLRIDQDDRIALLGKNGQGKSTLSKLLSDRLLLMRGQSGQLEQAAHRLFCPASGGRTASSTKPRCNT